MTTRFAALALLVPLFGPPIGLPLGWPVGAEPAVDGGPKYELPVGPTADLVAKLDGVAPWSQPFQAWPGDLDQPGWNRIEPWLEWARLVREEADSEYAKPLRRADLARLAAATGRDSDAWFHFQETKSNLPVAAAVLPYLFPGVPLDAAPGAPLTSEVVLRPCLPPPIERLPLGSFDPAKLRVDHFAVGAARLAVQLDLARDGVQIDVVHQSGEAVELQLVMCAPGGYSTTVEYLDWDRQPDAGLPRRIVARAGSESEAEHAFWGRFAPAELTWPSIADADPKRLLERLRRIGIELEVAPALEARACGLGLALEQLFGVRVRERLLGSPAPERVVAPLVLRLSEESGTAGMRVVMELAERLAFSR